MGHSRRGVGFLACAILLTAWVGTAGAAVTCGNGLIEVGEDCDDGGVCIGSINAGAPCTAAATCPGGTCTTFGGDGCAANCTTETDVPFPFEPGVFSFGDLAAGTSGATVVAEVLSIGLPITGGETLTIGKERDGKIPVVVKAASVATGAISIPGLACACMRGVALKTCGGTLYEPDNVTRSLDCTTDDTLCAGSKPCVFVHGVGNSASGYIGCSGGLSNVNVDVTQDSGGSGPASPPVVTLSGSGAPGSASLLSSTSVGVVTSPSCAGTNPVFGPDNLFCTDDDDPASRGLPATARQVTGTVTGLIANANGQDGHSVGPTTLVGSRLSCARLATGHVAGLGLVSVEPELDQPTLGDTLSALSLFSTGTCGDGAVNPNEQCDDGNTVSGDGCPADCKYSSAALIRGNRADPTQQSRGCEVEWYVANSHNPLDVHHLPSNRQSCRDADPGCDIASFDADGAPIGDTTAGLCRFHVVACLNNVDPHLPACSLDTIDAVSVLKPRPDLERNPQARAVQTANRSALESALTSLRDPRTPGAGFVYAPPLAGTQQNLCSAPFEIDVLVGALRHKRVSLLTRSTAATSRSGPHLSRLDLICSSRPLP
ncbi:MAG: DUF4215 domain-containing protein [Deltaproteobacteria bacterium]|nr:DUF4215 domain-containing protein [Deltaproteobacteria bacterium]